jgi:hypothetical protein
MSSDRIETKKEAPLQGVMIDYTNWRGERRVRHVLPFDMEFTESEWHPQPQWILKALDMERSDGVMRDFAMAHIHSWTPCTEAMLKTREAKNDS